VVGIALTGGKLGGVEPVVEQKIDGGAKRHKKNPRIA
jgi:hypothetical protein